MALPSFLLAVMPLGLHLSNKKVKHKMEKRQSSREEVEFSWGQIQVKTS